MIRMEGIRNIVTNLHNPYTRRRQVNLYFGTRPLWWSDICCTQYLPVVVGGLTLVGKEVDRLSWIVRDKNTFFIFFLLEKVCKKIKNGVFI